MLQDLERQMLRDQIISLWLSHFFKAVCCPSSAETWTRQAGSRALNLRFFHSPQSKEFSKAPIGKNWLLQFQTVGENNLLTLKELSTLRDAYSLKKKKRTTQASIFIRYLICCPFYNFTLLLCHKRLILFCLPKLSPFRLLFMQ